MDAKHRVFFTHLLGALLILLVLKKKYFSITKWGGRAGENKQGINKFVDLK